MPRLYYFSLVVMALLITLPSSQAATTPPAQMDAGFSSLMLERVIRLAIQESPNEYVAAVIESTGAPPVCEERDHQRVCRSRVRVLEMLAAKPSFDLKEFYLLGESSESWSPSERTLLFAIPMPDLADGYGATYMSTRTDQTTVEKLRRVLNTVIGE